MVLELHSFSVSEKKCELKLWKPSREMGAGGRGWESLKEHRFSDAG